MEWDNTSFADIKAYLWAKKWQIAMGFLIGCLFGWLLGKVL